MLAACEGKTSRPLLHFSKFFVNPNFDLETDYIFGKPIKDVFNDILSVRKYYQLFTHEWNIFLLKYAIQTNGAKIPKTSLPFRKPGPHRIHLYPSTDSTHHPKWHPDPISRFATVHTANKPTDRQTDRQTDKWDWLQVCMKSAYALFF